MAEIQIITIYHRCLFLWRRVVGASLVFLREETGEPVESPTQ